MHALEIKAEAYLEIEDAFLWYETKQAGLGGRFLSELEHHLNLIQKYPKNFSVNYRAYRQCILKVFPFVIIFEIEGKSVVVYSVFHMSRNPENQPG
jgi:hypothetical protein